MVVPSPCCTGCPLLHATDTRGITTDYKRGKHADGGTRRRRRRKKKKGVTRVAHARGWGSKKKGVTRVEEEEEGCYTGRGWG
jgi:hypothetical protein